MTEISPRHTLLWLDQAGIHRPVIESLLDEKTVLDGPHPLAGNIVPDSPVSLVLVTVSCVDPNVDAILRTYNATTNLHRVPIVVLGNLSPNDIVTLLSAGADEVLTFDQPDFVLAAKLRAFMRAGDRLRSLEGRQSETSRRLATVSREKLQADELIRELETKEQEIRNQSRQIEKLLKEIHGQLVAATNLQLNLLPKIVPDPQAVKLYDRFIPAGALGGDFYDYVLYDDGDFDVLIADTSGHGVSAALVSVQVRAVVRTFVQDMLQQGRRVQPAEILKHLNTFMLESFAGAFFMTMYYLSYSAKTGAITYSGAGHNPFLFLSRQGRKPVQFFSQNLPLGLIAAAEYKQDLVDWEFGDRMLLYTDGLVEVTDKNGDVFGPDRLIRTIRANYDLTGEALLDALLIEVEVFGGKGPKYPDDVTIILMERTH